MALALNVDKNHKKVLNSIQYKGEDTHILSTCIRFSSMRMQSPCLPLSCLAGREDGGDGGDDGRDSGGSGARDRIRVLN